MANPNITGLRFMRQRDAHGFMGRALFARTFVILDTCVETRIVPPITGLAQGRIVSISRGSPPPKQR
ncbi:MAG: hypothetical protein ABI234_04765 [Ktedonobacteraceae bacterium]